MNVLKHGSLSLWTGFDLWTTHYINNMSLLNNLKSKFTAGALPSLLLYCLPASISRKIILTSVEYKVNSKYIQVGRLSLDNEDAPFK